MTWHVIRVRSKDAQKQLARTSLNRLMPPYPVAFSLLIHLIHCSLRSGFRFALVRASRVWFLRERAGSILVTISLAGLYFTLNGSRILDLALNGSSRSPHIFSALAGSLFAG